MSRWSVVVKLWISIVALLAVTLAILAGAVARVVSDFYVRTRVDELTRHGQVIVDLIESGETGWAAGATSSDGGASAGQGPQISPETSRLVELVATLTGATVAIVSHEGRVLNCSQDGPNRRDESVGVHNDIINAIMGQSSWSVGADPFTGQPALSVAMPLRLFTRTAALLFVAPTGPINLTIRTIEGVLLAISLAAIAVLTILAFLLSRSLSRPLRNMAVAASEMAAGHFSTRIKVGSEDEVGQLGRSLNNLSGRLSQSLSALAAERDQLAEVLARERELVQAQKEFVANVSHELRTPLTYLQGYSEALLDGLAGEEDERKFLAIINDETRRLRRLVADLLDLTVIESGQAPFHPRLIVIADVLEDVVQSLGTIARDRRVAIVGPKEGPDRPRQVWADPDRTKQVVVNLLDNAIRHSPPGSTVTLSIADRPPRTQDPGDRGTEDATASGAHGARAEAEPGPRYTWVWVTDRGPGLDPAILPKVWTRFFKADRARRRDKGGTGLGLAIVRSIVEAQGGRVVAVSTPGQGATFAFSLPAHEPGNGSLPAPPGQRGTPS